MENVKHTHWNLVWEKQGEDWVVEKSDGSMNPVCWVRDSKEAAQLIAAAPELLEALKAAIEFRDTGKRKDWVELAHKAIKKATNQP